MLSHIDCDRVQDAYCFRCSPQVHGPVIDMIREVRRILEIEINSATDNPLVFVDDDGSADIISGGNFHGQNLSLASDSIAIACHELASISERRINQLLDPNWSGQHAFLAKNEGLESGLMIVQYVAAAVIAELHLLANPVSTSNVPVSMGKEDHVSMGATIRDGMAEAMIKHLPESTVRRLGIFAHGEENVKVHRDEPVFDGQFSNRCYREAVKQAFTHFSEKAIAQNRFDPDMDIILTEQCARIIMHLPYAFQAKRMFPDVFRHDRQHLESWKHVESEIGEIPPEEMKRVFNLGIGYAIIIPRDVDYGTQIGEIL